MSTTQSPPATGGRIKELRKQADVLYKEIRKLELLDRIEEAKHFLGRMFTFQSSYGGKNFKCWNGYVRVIDVSDDGFPLCYVFQIDSVGRLEIETRKVYMTLDGMQEITLAEFQTAWLDVACFIVDNHPSALADSSAHAPGPTTSEEKESK